VLVIDIEMPRMDGLTFLKKIMSEHPTPTIVCSSLAEKGAAATMEALAAGALAIITKPKMGVKQFLQDAATTWPGAVRAAARANMRHWPAPATAGVPPPKLTADAMLAAQAGQHPRHGGNHRPRGGHRHLHRRHPGAGSRADPPCPTSAAASSSSSTCRRNSPPCSPSASTACASWKCARP
jgi:chemotaxis response regulator CheB